MKKAVLIITGLLILLSQSLIAQTPETLLMYGRNVNGQFSGVYVSSEGTRIVHDTPPGRCGGTSPNGLFAALSLQEDPTTVNLIYKPSNIIFGQIPWQENWYPCASVWLDDETLVLREAASFNNIAAMFTIQDNVLREVPVSVPPAPTPVPPLPNADISPLRESIFSNQRTKVVYLRCADGPGAENFCSGYPDWAIYDLSLSREITILRDADMNRMLGQAYFQNSFPYYRPFYTWSPDDRFFLYDSYGSGKFSIYDTVAQQALDVPEQSWELDLDRLPVWSPDSRYVAYWTVGVPDSDDLFVRYNITSYEVSRSYRGLLIYDTQQQDFLGSGIWLQLGQDYSTAIVWSPDTPELVTWGMEGDLYRLNVETGEEAVIDTDVTGVIAWSYTRPIPSVELPVVTPTPTFRPTQTP